MALEFVKTGEVQLATFGEREEARCQTNLCNTKLENILLERTNVISKTFFRVSVELKNYNSHLK